MTPYAQSPRRPPPAFVPVPLRARADGWTPLRQAEFLGRLAQTGCVAQAARAVGMRRESAHRLRRKPGAESFADAWDRALGLEGMPRRKITLWELRRRAFDGLLKPVLCKGRYVRTDKKYDDSATLRLLARKRRASPAMALPLVTNSGKTPSNANFQSKSSANLPFSPSGLHRPQRSAIGTP